MEIFLTPASLATLITLHALSAVFWLGGLAMYPISIWPSINHTVTRQREYLSASVEAFTRFVPWLIAFALISLFSGLALLAFKYGFVFKAMPIYLHIMLALGLVAVLLVGHLLFSPWKRLKKSLESGKEEDLIVAERQLHKLKFYLWLQIILTLLLVIIGNVGSYFPAR
jgi:uncharacterized membrane protein